MRWLIRCRGVSCGSTTEASRASMEPYAPWTVPGGEAPMMWCGLNRNGEHLCVSPAIFQGADGGMQGERPSASTSCMTRGLLTAWGGLGGRTGIQLECRWGTAGGATCVFKGARHHHSGCFAGVRPSRTIQTMIVYSWDFRSAWRGARRKFKASLVILPSRPAGIFPAWNGRIPAAALASKCATPFAGAAFGPHMAKPKSTASHRIGSLCSRGTQAPFVSLFL